MRNKADAHVLRAFTRLWRVGDGRPVSAAAVAYGAYRGEIGAQQILAAQAALDALTRSGAVVEVPAARFQDAGGLQIRAYCPGPRNATSDAQGLGADRKPSRRRRRAVGLAIAAAGRLDEPAEAGTMPGL